MKQMDSGKKKRERIIVFRYTQSQQVGLFADSMPYISVKLLLQGYVQFIDRVRLQLCVNFTLPHACFSKVCVCLCVCVCGGERERERELSLIHI